MRKSFMNPSHDNRIESFILIGDPDMFKTLCRSPWAGIDGNHKFQFCGFSQLILFTFREIVRGKRRSYVGAYALITNKTEFLYTHLFNGVKEVSENLCPDILNPIKWKNSTLDFEAAFINALFNVFSILAWGCYFHFTQKTIKKIRNLGLIRAYNVHDSYFNTWVRLLLVLAHLPPELVSETYDDLKNEMYEDVETELTTAGFEIQLQEFTGVT